MESARSLDRVWEELDPRDPATVAWGRPVPGRRVAVLLGGFDPPTRAHVSILTAASRVEGVPGALCMTKVLLDRPDELLTPVQRLRLLDRIARTRGFGLLVANRGTYVEVDRALRDEGVEGIFVVGSDKLAQLTDASFYSDGTEGVERTFAHLRFLVVPRPGADVRRDDLRLLDPSVVFEDPEEKKISSTEARRLIRVGAGVEALVPPEVALDLEGYTAAK